MTSSSGIPRPFSITDAKRSREEEARKREQATSARNTSSTTIGAGGKLDLDGGDLTVSNGGNAVVKDGGVLSIEQGGGAEITGDGEIVVIGEGRDWYTREPVEVRSCLANRLADNSWIGYQYLQPGLYFNAGTSQGATDPRVTSEDGVGLNIVSAVLPLQRGPQVGANMVTSANLRVAPEFASIGTSAWDDTINPGGGNGLAGQKGSSYAYFTPSSMGIQLTNETSGTPAIPAGIAAGITADLSEGKLQLTGRNGVNVEGGFTVNGSPVGGAVSSVNTKTGDVVLGKADIGLGNVDNTSDASKPVSTATQSALDAKAATAYVDAQIAAVKTGMHAPIALSGFTMAGMFSVKPPVNGVTEIVADIQVTRTGGTLSLTTSWTALGNIAPAQALKAGVGLRYFTAFATAAGAVYFYINFETGACGIRAVSGTLSVLNTSIISFSQSVLL